MSKPRDSLNEVAIDGHFIRTPSTYREVISPEHPTYKPEADRYHLYISLACPWANGTYLVRKLKGLEDIVSVSIVHPTWQYTRPDQDDFHTGWAFCDPSDEDVVPVSGHGLISCAGTIPDSVNSARYVRDLYDFANDTSGKFTVPVLWDKQTGTIVNNESMEIIKMFNSVFNELLPAGSPQRSLDLYPEGIHAEFDELNDWIYHNINNGVYRCGFAKNQTAYISSFHALFGALDRTEDILSRQRYIISGGRFTLLDIRLFMTLIRFDEVYVVYFKTNKKFLTDYPNINNYMREIYQMPGVASCINMDHIKNHYFTSHPTLNTYSIVPVGPGVIDDMQLPHDRAPK